MSFKLKTTKTTRDFKDVPRDTALAVTKGNLYSISLTTGSLEVAGAATSQAQEVYRSSRTLASGTTPVHCLIVASGDEFIADTVNNTAVTHRGQRVVLNADGDKVNNTGTDAPAGVFEIISIIGVAADKKVIVKRV